MKKIQRSRRHRRITAKIKGTLQRPRLVVFKSKKHIYAQLIDDSAHRVLLSCSSLSKDFKDKPSDVNGAKALGAIVAQQAIRQGVKNVSFDRGGYKDHGRIKGLAEAAREAGLKF